MTRRRNFKAVIALAVCDTAKAFVTGHSLAHRPSHALASSPADDNEPLSWQESLEQLTNPRSSLAEKQILLQALAFQVTN